MLNYYFYVIDNYDISQRRFLGLRPAIALIEERYKILTELSNIKIEYAKIIIDNLNGLQTEYIWGTDMLKIKSYRGFSKIFYTVNEVCDTEFEERIPNIMLVEILKNWIVFLEVVEKKFLSLSVSAKTN